MVSTISYLILPLLFSGVVHHFLIIKHDLLKLLKIPVDFDATFFGQRVFGDSKTFRGFIVMTIPTGIFMYLFSFLYHLNDGKNYLVTTETVVLSCFFPNFTFPSFNANKV